MQTSEALRILQALADGADPETGEALPADSPYQNAQVVRALMVAIRAVERQQDKEEKNRSLPENAGKAWTDEEDKQLCQRFDSGMAVKELARQHLRTGGAIQSRLERLGKIQPTGTITRRT